MNTTALLSHKKGKQRGKAKNELSFVESRGHHFDFYLTNTFGMNFTNSLTVVLFTFVIIASYGIVIYQI